LRGYILEEDGLEKIGKIGKYKEDFPIFYLCMSLVFLRSYPNAINFNESAARA